jgi:hypothetical protein
MNLDLGTQRTALITLDLQNCFLRDSPIAAPEGPAVDETIAKIGAAA